MKLLLLTDVPPCRLYSGALVTYRLCSFLPQGSLCCAAVVDPKLKAIKVDPSLNWIPTEYFEKPQESYLGRRIGPGRLATSFIGENLIRPVQLSKLASRIAAFAGRQQITAIWCILQGQTMTRLATLVATRLGVPLLTQVWDPLSWWLDDRRVDPISRGRLLANFDSTIRSSVRCATASWTMSEDYEKRYGVPTVPVIAGIDQALAKTPNNDLRTEDEFIIGLAGQLYATSEWASLVRALSRMNWRIDGRRVVVRLLGNQMPPHLIDGFPLEIHSPIDIRLLGWRTQAETIEILSKTDLLYCPYWFDERHREPASLCFPSKLVTYLAAARPILVHAPLYSSPARFAVSEGCAAVCDSLEEDVIGMRISALAQDEAERQRLSMEAARAFRKHFTIETMRESFARFLGAESEEFA